MPEQVAGQPTPETPEWTQESIDKQIAEQSEPKPEPEPQAEPKPEVHKVVPLTALHEERSRRKEAAQRAQFLEQQNQQLQRQMQEYMAAKQPKPPGDDDPLGQLRYGQEKTADELKQIRETNERNAQVDYQRQQMQAFVGKVQAADLEFKERQPDSHDAIDYLRKGLLEEYKAQGATRAQAVEAIQQEEARMSWIAMQQGENPAEIAFNRAVARGYTPAAKKLAMQKEGQGASMPTGTGGKAGGQLSLESLLKMGSAEFNKATAGANWEKLMKNR